MTKAASRAAARPMRAAAHNHDDTQDIIRHDVHAMTSYPVPDATGLVKLDAMENPFRLPADARRAARRAAGGRRAEPLSGAAPGRRCSRKIKRAMNVPPAGCELMLGNGSDELICCWRWRATSRARRSLAPVPGFVMYEMSAQLQELEFVGVPLNADFELDADAMLAAIDEHRPAIIYLAYPNNPTGTLFDDAVIERIIAAASQEPGRDRRGLPAVRRSAAGCRAPTQSTTCW